jgi:hypothetical protein
MHRCLGVAFYIGEVHIWYIHLFQICLKALNLEIIVCYPWRRRLMWAEKGVLLAYVAAHAGSHPLCRLVRQGWARNQPWTASPAAFSFGLLFFFLLMLLGLL